MYHQRAGAVEEKAFILILTSPSRYEDKAMEVNGSIP